MRKEILESPLKNLKKLQLGRLVNLGRFSAEKNFNFSLELLPFFGLKGLETLSVSGSVHFRPLKSLDKVCFRKVEKPRIDI